eukprot:g2693.t1
MQEFEDHFADRDFVRLQASVVDLIYKLGPRHFQGLKRKTYEELLRKYKEETNREYGAGKDDEQEGVDGGAVEQKGEERDEDIVEESDRDDDDDDDLDLSDEQVEEVLQSMETDGYDKSKVTISLTFGDCAENSSEMEQMGKMVDAGSGFCVEDLERAQRNWRDCTDCKTELIRLHERVKGRVPHAAVLVVRGGVKALLGERTVDELFDEQLALPVDKLKFSKKHGGSVNSRARFNLCFDEKAQEPSIEEKKGRVVAFDEVELLNNVRKSLPRFFGKKAERLLCELNLYYDVTDKRVGIGWHGDAERRKVIALRLGADFPLRYVWFKHQRTVGDPVEVMLSHGDLYVMSEKAVGTDWKKHGDGLMTLRHSAGFSKTFSALKPKWLTPPNLKPKKKKTVKKKEEAEETGRGNADGGAVEQKGEVEERDEDIVEESDRDDDDDDDLDLSDDQVEEVLQQMRKNEDDKSKVTTAKKDGEIVLKVRQPYADLLVDGKKTWEIRKKKVVAHVGKRVLIFPTGGDAVIIGHASLDECRVVTREELAANVDKHQIADWETSEYCRGEVLYSWVFRDAQRFDKPLEAPGVKGAAVIWARYVAEETEAQGGNVSGAESSPKHVEYTEAFVCEARDAKEQQNRQDSRAVIKQTRSAFDDRLQEVVCDVILKEKHTVRKEDVNIKSRVEEVRLEDGRKVARRVVTRFGDKRGKDPFKFLEGIFRHALEAVQQALKWNDTDHVYIYLKPDEENNLSWALHTEDMALKDLKKNLREQILEKVARVLTSQETFTLSSRTVININRYQCVLGAGRVRPTSEEVCLTKRGVVKILNDDTTCCARTIVVCRAYNACRDMPDHSAKDCNIADCPRCLYKKLRRPGKAKSPQGIAAVQLHESTGIPVRPEGSTMKDVLDFALKLGITICVVCCESSNKGVIYFDFETEQETGWHVVNKGVAMYEDQSQKFVFNTLDEFCLWLFQGKHKGFTAIAHCGARFDFNLVTQWVYENNLKAKPNYNGSKILTSLVDAQSLNIRLVDSYNFLPCPLAKLPGMFGLDETRIRKGDFPHGFNTKANQQYRGVMPPLPTFFPDTKRGGARAALIKWHKKQCEGGDMDVLDDIAPTKKRGAYLKKIDMWRVYCKDVQEAKYAQEDFYRALLAQMAAYNGVVRAKYLPENSLGVVKDRVNNFSRDSIVWLEYVKETEGVDIQHALDSRGEFSYRSATGKKRSCDGFARKDKQIYEYDGCYSHGCSECYPAEELEAGKKGDSFREKQVRTEQRNRDHVRKFGKPPIIMTEHRWQLMKRDPKYAEAIKKVEERVDKNFVFPVKARQFMHGGRTECGKLYHKFKTKDEGDFDRWSIDVDLHGSLKEGDRVVLKLMGCWHVEIVKDGFEALEWDGEEDRDKYRERVMKLLADHTKLKLHEQIHRLKHQVIYMDSDSVKYDSFPGGKEVKQGSILGEWTNEFDVNGVDYWITDEFVSTGAKTYAYRYTTDAPDQVLEAKELDRTYETCKCAGFTLNHEGSLAINFETMRDLVLGRLVDNDTGELLEEQKLELRALKICVQDETRRMYNYMDEEQKKKEKGKLGMNKKLVCDYTKGELIRTSDRAEGKDILTSITVVPFGWQEGSCKGNAANV